MANLHLADFAFLRMWPRRLFGKQQNGRLVIKLVVQKLQRPGVYVLYKGDEPYYVGKATRNLFGRLHSHSNKVTDEYHAHWDHFSAFALEPGVTNTATKLAEIEAILIAAMPRATNRSKPRFKIARIPKSLLSPGE